MPDNTEQHTQEPRVYTEENTTLREILIGDKVIRERVDNETGQVLYVIRHLSKISTHLA